MSASQYKRILLIAEALLRKVNLPVETVSKYQELRESIVGEDNIFSNSQNQSLEKVTQLQPNELGNTFREEIISMQNMFMDTILDVLSGVLAKTVGDTVNTNEIMQGFIESFEKRRT